MKKDHLKSLKQVTAGILCAILVQCPVFFVAASAAEFPSELYARGAVLMDGDSGRVLFSKSGDEFYPMASTTKIMTCILALELGNPDQIVTFSEYAASMPDVQMNAKAGEQYYLRDLLYSMMLESHNDSAVAVAESIAKDVEMFTDLMDKKAEAIGCMKTNFVTPNGLDGTDERGEHGLTAKDLAMILRYCIFVSPKAEEFLKITGTDFYEFSELNGKRQISCKNHNAFLKMYEGAFTGKTGFTGKAGYCYTGAVKKEDRTLIVALLGSGWYPHKTCKWKDMSRLVNYGFENFHYEEVGKDKWELTDIPVIDGVKETVAVKTEAKKIYLLLGESEEIVCKVKMAKQLEAPVLENTVVGTIFYELNGMVVEQFQIYTAEKTEKNTLWNCVKQWLRIIQDFVRNITKKSQNT